MADGDSEGVTAALVESDAVGTVASDGATVGVADVLAPAESFVSPGLAASDARLDGVAVGATVGFDVAGGFEDGLTVGVAEPCPPPLP